MRATLCLQRLLGSSRTSFPYSLPLFYPKMICSNRPWLIENGLTILECVATPYGEIYPQEVVQVLVGES